MDDAQEQLAPSLLPGETLLWSGRPDPTKHLTRVDLFVVPFSLLWCGFSVVWLLGALDSGASTPLALVGVPFVLFGIYFIVGRFVVKARRKRVTAYGLTRGRALVAVGRGSVSETPLVGTSMDRRLSRDGRHLDVVFGGSGGGRSTGPSYANTGLELFDRGGSGLGFYDVSDTAGLDRALREVRR